MTSWRRRAINKAGDARQGADGASGPRPPTSATAIQPLEFDVDFSGAPGGFEIRYSDRTATDFRPELADQSADWLEDQLGVLNLGQVDSRLLIADGALTDAVKDGLVAWWSRASRRPHCWKWAPESGGPTIVWTTPTGPGSSRTSSPGVSVGVNSRSSSIGTVLPWGTRSRPS